MPRPTHKLKTWPSYFQRVWTGEKTFEVRLDDRGYQKGDEVVQAARNAGRQVFKIRIRQCEAARAITTGYRMRDVRRGWPSGEGADSLPGTRYNIPNVDAITDRGNVWLTVEGPVVS